jgi:hypothetical protein
MALAVRALIDVSVICRVVKVQAPPGLSPLGDTAPWSWHAWFDIVVPFPLLNMDDER